MVGREVNGLSGFDLKEEQVKKLAILSLVAVAGGANAVQLYTNGAVTDDVNSSSVPVSKVQGLYNFGAGAQGDADNWVADDFTVTGGNWIVDRIDVYCYLPGASSTSNPFTGLSIKVGATAGDGSNLNLSNASISQQFVGYRARSSNLNDTSRPIYRLTLNLGSSMVLTLGNSYWVAWSAFDNNQSQDAFVSYVVPTTGGNAKQSLVGGAFNTYADAGTGVEFPFEMYGTVPEPGTMIALGAGLAAIAARRRRK